MTFTELRDRIITDGIASVKRHETRPLRIEGMLKGFEELRALNCYVDVEACLQERHNVEMVMYRQRVKTNEYWLYRYATSQIEWAYEIFKVGLNIYPMSGNAIKKYAAIVGVAK